MLIGLSILASCVTSPPGSPEPPAETCQPRPTAELDESDFRMLSAQCIEMVRLALEETPGMACRSLEYRWRPELPENLAFLRTDFEDTLSSLLEEPPPLDSSGSADEGDGSPSEVADISVLVHETTSMSARQINYWLVLTLWSPETNTVRLVAEGAIQKSILAN